MHSRERNLIYEESYSDSEYDVSDDSTIGSYSVDYHDDYQDNEFGVQTDLQELEYETVKSGMWVMVIYDEEKWIGRVLEKAEGQVRVQCLEMLFGVTGSQKLKSDHEGKFYFQVYKTDVIPRQSSSGTGKKLLWNY